MVSGHGRVEVEYWVQNSFICVGDPDKIHLPERRSKSLPPRAFMDACNTSATCCNELVKVQRRSKGGTRCKRCRGRKGDRCRCVSKATSRKAMGTDAADGEFPVARLRPDFLIGRVFSNSLVVLE